MLIYLDEADELRSDDEYRLLRQNLFERFSTTTTVPTESPVVPVTKLRPRSNDSPSASGRCEFGIIVERPAY
jgi:hypothetical protein